MPYVIKKRKGPRPYKIINTDRNEVVGSSTSKAMAEISVRHRLGAENDQDQARRYVRDRKKATGKKR